MWLLSCGRVLTDRALRPLRGTNSQKSPKEARGKVAGMCIRASQHHILHTGGAENLNFSSKAPSRYQIATGWSIMLEPQEPRLAFSLLKHSFTIAIEVIQSMACCASPKTPPGGWGAGRGPDGSLQRKKRNVFQGLCARDLSWLAEA